MNALKLARPLAHLRQGRNDWYRIENGAGSGVAEVYIYDEIGYFGITADDLVKDLRNIKTSKIDLHVNSPGGDVFDGIAIYNVLRDHDATVTTYVDGLAASIASVISMAGEEIVVAKTASMMIHDGHGLCVGNAEDMRELADLLDKQSNIIAGVYADRAGGEVAEWRDRMRVETWYDADEAVAAGLADRIGGDSAAENSWDLSIFAHAGRTQAPAPQIAARFDPEYLRAAMKEVFA